MGENTTQHTVKAECDNNNKKDTVKAEYENNKKKDKVVKQEMLVKQHQRDLKVLEPKQIFDFQFTIFI